jgi:hypothetical protein
LTRRALAAVALQDNLLSGWISRGYTGQFDHLVYTGNWPKIDKLFQDGRPDPRLPDDKFSYTFDSTLTVATAGTYAFELESDDDSRLFIDDELVLNHWGNRDLLSEQARLALESGPHKPRIEYFEGDGWAGIRFRYAPPGGALTYDVPVTTAPLPLAQVQLFTRQIDAAGNASAWIPVKLTGE